MRASAVIVAILASASGSCALIDATRSAAPDVPASCNSAPNGCICSPDSDGTDSACRTDEPVAGAICCNEAVSNTCACAVPACYIDPSNGNCLCGVFAGSDSFGLDNAPGNMCAASGSNVVCCESHGSDYPSCTCGPECGPDEVNVGSACTPAAVNNCGALAAVDQCN